MTQVFDELPERVLRDMMSMIVGDKLGEGIDRVTYVWPTDPTKVVKFQVGQYYFQNHLEYTIWCRVKDTEHAKWFAPCYGCSANGMVLLQKRTRPLPKNLPLEMPAFLTDFSRRNYGMIGNRIVCHDYGFPEILNQIFAKGSRALKLRKVEWRD